MLKNPFLNVRPWMGHILQSIKKDLKADHLTVDKNFYRAHFGSKPHNKLTLEEMFAVYERELLAGNEQLVEWAANRWVFRHGDLYQYFAKRLSAINPEFFEIESLNEEQAKQVLEGSDAFDAVDVYLFSRLNGVVFPQQVFERLEAAANEAAKSTKDRKESESSQESLVKELERYRREARRMKEKYEDKLAGVQRKYQTDMEALKKQIRALQQKLEKQP